MSSWKRVGERAAEIIWCCLNCSILIRCLVLFNELPCAPPCNNGCGEPRGLGSVPVVPIKDVGSLEFLVLCYVC